MVPVRGKDCQGHPHEFWEIPIFLTSGDAGYYENPSVYSQFTEKPGGSTWRHNVLFFSELCYMLIECCHNTPVYTYKCVYGFLNNWYSFSKESFFREKCAYQDLFFCDGVYHQPTPTPTHILLTHVPRKIKCVTPCTNNT